MLLGPLIILILFPFAVMIVTALKPPTEVLFPTWKPSSLQWSNFRNMGEATRFFPALRNSLVVSLSATAITLIVSIPAAYAMNRWNFAGRNLFHRFLLVSQMLAPIVLVVGLFRLIVRLGLLDSLASLILVYAAFNIAFTVWMLRSYFATIPKELEEAAWLEGAGFTLTIIKVFLPLALPAIAVTAIFAIINCWNEFVIALTMLRRQENYTLPIQIFSLVAGRYTIEWHHVMAATLAATLPVALIFAWLQRYLVRALALGAVK